MYEQQIKFIFDYHRMQGDTGLKSLNHISMLASPLVQTIVGLLITSTVY